MSNDFNGDGLPDVAVVLSNNSQFGILLNRSTIASASPPSLTFATQGIGSLSTAQATTVTHQTNPDVMVPSRVFVTGPDHNDFLVSSDGCSGIRVRLSESCDVSVRFAPSEDGARTATLNVAYNRPASPVTIPMTGTGGGLPVGPTGSTGATGDTGTPGAPGTTGTSRARRGLREGPGRTRESPARWSSETGEGEPR